MLSIVLNLNGGGELIMDKADWNWWQGIVSGNSPCLVNPSLSVLADLCTSEHARHPGEDQGLFADAAHAVGTNILLSSKGSGKDDLRCVGASVYSKEKQEFMKKINFLKERSYVLEGELGFGPDDALGVMVITTSPDHAFFLKRYLRPKTLWPSLGSILLMVDPWAGTAYKHPLCMVSLQDREILVLDAFDVKILKEALDFAFKELAKERAR